MKSRLLIVGIVCSLASFGQKELSLEDCIATGLEQNYSIRIVRNQQHITDNNVTPGNAGYLPTLGIEAGYGGTVYDNKYDYSNGTTARVNGVNNATGDVGLNLNWTIFDGFGIQAEYAKLKELKQMGALNTRLTIEAFISSLSSEYYNQIRQTTRLKNLRSSLDLSRERLRIVEERYTIGSMSRLDLQQAKVDFNADSSQYITQLEVVHTSRVRLRELMGLDEPDTEIGVRDTSITLNVSLEKEQLWNSAISSNTSLLIVQNNKTLSEQEYRKVKSVNYPYLKMNAGYGYTNSTYGSGTTDRQQRLGTNYGLTLGYTLFDGMNRKREQKNARIDIANQELRIKEMELALRADMSNSWMAYRNNLNLWTLEKENLVAAMENYSIAIDRYKLGDLSGIELRTSQNSLIEAEERQSIAEYNTKLCEISLLQISGTIIEVAFPQGKDGMEASKK